jgi:exopolysaccharide production protein ExoQ
LAKDFWGQADETFVALLDEAADWTGVVTMIAERPVFREQGGAFAAPVGPVWQGFEAAAPRFTAYLAPWALQGVLLLCVTRGSPPFLSSGGDDMYSSSIASGLISGTALFAAVTAIWLLTVLLMVPARTWTLSNFRKHRLALSLPILAMVSTVWSSAPRISAGEGLELLLLTLVGIYIASEFDPGQQMKLLMITGTIAALSSLFLAVAVPTVGLDHIGHVGAVKGIFTQKNTCGSFMLILATPAFFVRNASGTKSLVGTAYGLLCGLLVYLSQSRTCWMLFLILIALAGALSVLRRFRSRDGVFLAVVVAAVGGLLGWVVYSHMGLLTEGLGKESSFSGRTLIWNYVLGAIGKRPLLGYGFMAYFSPASTGPGAADIAAAVGFPVQHPHDGYLSVWLDLGLTGLVLLVLYVLRALKDAKLTWKLAPYTDWYIAIIVIVLLSNIDERGLGSTNDISWLMFVIACTGLHLAAKRVRNSL